jgi:hypothetical protein
LKLFIKYSLKENTSLVAFDAHRNPGFVEKYRKQIALCLLKNIEYMKRNGIEIKDEWIRPENLTFKIPARILENLGINKIMERSTNFNNTFDQIQQSSNSKSPSTRVKQTRANSSFTQ